MPLLAWFFLSKRSLLSLMDTSLWCWTASPVATEAVAKRHCPDGGAVVGVRPAGCVRGAAVEAHHALQEALAPEEEAETAHKVEGILTSLCEALGQKTEEVWLSAAEVIFN